MARSCGSRATAGDLIDAATDRADRGRNVVVSFGAAVGGGYSWSRWDLEPGAQTANCKSDPCTVHGIALTLPVGLAIDWLPEHFFRGPFVWVAGLHGQIVFADLAEYAATSHGDVIKPEPATALMPGLRAGLSLGDPDVNVILGGGIGYAPLARFSDSEQRGVWRADVSASFYVPFIDLN